MNFTCANEDGNLARVFVATLEDGSKIECVESTQPPLPRSAKWVLIVSTLKGCPVGCPICDAGGHYRGKLTKDEIFEQIEFLLKSRYPSTAVPVPKLKIQFARMGDPALNPAVLDVLRELPLKMDLPGLMPSISTVAPFGRDAFFTELSQIKDQFYSSGRFQMQFSLHTTNIEARRRLVPIRTWDFEQIAIFGDRFYHPGDRKITLNFAPADGLPLKPTSLLEYFSPEKYLVKLTPINPTKKAIQSGLRSVIDPSSQEKCESIARRFERAGFETILSIGELEENIIGSNCGMYVTDSPG